MISAPEALRTYSSVRTWLQEHTDVSRLVELSLKWPDLWSCDLPLLFLVGFPTEGLGPAVWQGGETEALARLDKHLERKVWPHSYDTELGMQRPFSECLPHAGHWAEHF